MPTAESNLRGAGWIVASAAVATVMSAGVHELAGHVHSAQTVFVRGALGSVMILAVIIPRADFQIRTNRLRLHLLRGILGVIAINLGFYSLMILPLATVSALFFTTPLFVTAFSIPLLGERVGPRRAIASIVGFFGALAVVGYLPEPLHIRWLAPIFASVFFAVTLILGKRLSTTEHPGTIVFYFAVILAIGSLPPAIIIWENPTLHEWFLLILIAAMSSLRNYMDVKGYALGEAHFIAPFLYTRMIFMVLMGYFFFFEVPTLSALGGALVIILCTLYILRRELVHGRRDIVPKFE